MSDVGLVAADAAQAARDQARQTRQEAISGLVPTQSFSAKVGLVWLGALGLALLLVGLCAPDPNDGFADGATVLAFVTSAAVAIERTIEGFWTLAASRWGGWFPLKQINTAFASYEAETNKLLKDPLTKVQEVAAQLKAVAGRTPEQVAEIDQLIDDVNRQTDRLAAKVKSAEKLAPGSPRFGYMTEVTSDALGTFRAAASKADQFQDKAGKAITDAAEDIADGCSRVEEFVTSFTDNPARKLASLAAGALLGLAVAGFMGLNLFLAALDKPSDLFAGVGGIMLTGIIIGFGANPTHEVIKALQGRKPSTLTPGPTPGTGVSSDILGVEYADAPASRPALESSFRRSRELRQSD